MFLKPKYFLVLIMACFILACTRNVPVNFTVVDKIKNTPLPQSKIEIKTKKTENGITNDKGTFNYSLNKKDVPDDQILRFNVQKEGYAPYQKNINLYPLKDDYPIRVPMEPKTFKSELKVTSDGIALAEAETGKLSVTVTNTGNMNLGKIWVSASLPESFSLKGWEIQKDEVHPNKRYAIDGLTPGESKEIGLIFEVNQKVKDGKYEITIELKGEQIKGDSKMVSMTIETSPPDLRMELKCENEIANLSLTNKGKKEIRDLKIRITMSGKINNPGKEEGIDEISVEKVPPSEQVKKEFNLRQLTADKGYLDTKILRSYVGCKNCDKLEKSKLITQEECVVPEPIVEQTPNISVPSQGQ